MLELNPFQVRSITAFRKKKNLCLKCGKHDASVIHVCEHNYYKADMTGIEVPPDSIIKDDVVIDEEWMTNQIKKNTITSYRNKKNLCVKCGLDVNTGDHSICVECFDKADMRHTEEIKSDPRVVITPKKQISSIGSDILIERTNEVFINESNNPFYKMTKTCDINTIKPYIIIDITPSTSGARIDFSYVEFMAKRYNILVYLIGDMNKYFKYMEVQTIRKKLFNIHSILNVSDQNMVNYIHGCVKFIGFPSKYLMYSFCHSKSCLCFCTKNNILDISGLNTVIIEDDKNVDSDIIKRNVLSWRLS